MTRPLRRISARIATASTFLLLSYVSPAHAQSRTTMEIGVGTYIARLSDGWSGQLGLLGQVAVRRPIARKVSARVGVMGMQRAGAADGVPPRVRAVGGTAEIIWDRPANTPLYFSMGIGVYAVRESAPSVDESYQHNFGSLALVSAVGRRYAIGKRTLEVRIGLIEGDLGAGVRAATFGVIVTP